MSNHLHTAVYLQPVAQLPDKDFCFLHAMTAYAAVADDMLLKEDCWEGKGYLVEAGFLCCKSQIL